MSKRQEAERRHQAMKKLLENPHATADALKAIGIDVPTLPIWESDPEAWKPMLAARAEIAVEDVSVWRCPCCNVAAAVYASAPSGNWFILIVSTQEKSHDGKSIVCRFDTIDEIDELKDTWPHEYDRGIIEAYMSQGLREVLRELFVA